MMPVTTIAYPPLISISQVQHINNFSVQHSRDGQANSKENSEAPLSSRSVNNNRKRSSSVDCGATSARKSKPQATLLGNATRIGWQRALRTHTSQAVRGGPIPSNG